MIQTLDEKAVDLKVKTVVKIIIFIIASCFSVAMAYSAIANNSKDIAEIMPQISKIPVIETKVEFLVDGMEKLTNTKFKD